MKYFAYFIQVTLRNVSLQHRIWYKAEHESYFRRPLGCMTDSSAFSFCNHDQTSGIFLFKHDCWSWLSLRWNHPYKYYTLVIINWLTVTKYPFLKLSVWFRFVPTSIPDKTLSDLCECHIRNRKWVHPDVVFWGEGGACCSSF